MAKCDVCDKHVQIGLSRSHSQKASPKHFKPNVFRRHMVVNGEKVSMRICTRCMRTQVKTR